MWTVGLVASLISFSSIIAADTFAFVGGKVCFSWALPFSHYSSRENLSLKWRGILSDYIFSWKNLGIDLYCLKG